jgi:hypothetical protein
MPRSYINSFLMSSFSLISWGIFSLNFCPKSLGAFCLLFSRKPVVFALFCAGHFGADARLGSSATARVTLLTITSRPHILMQCAGCLQDGATRCAQLLNMLHDLPTEAQDPDDPITFQHRHRIGFPRNVPSDHLRHAHGQGYKVLREWECEHW